jgi:hypothetical protein
VDELLARVRAMVRRNEPPLIQTVRGFGYALRRTRLSAVVRENLENVDSRIESEATRRAGLIDDLLRLGGVDEQRPLARARTGDALTGDCRGQR